MAAAILTAARLRELLSYDQKSGDFTRISRKKGVVLGEIAGSKMSHGYISICIDGIDYTAHRLAWFYVYGFWPNGYIDHINGERADNRISNLRDVTQSVNMQNVYEAKSNSKTGLRGVSWHTQRKKYTARIKVGGKYLSLGLHATPEAAHDAYMDAKRKMHEGCSR